MKLSAGAARLVSDVAAGSLERAEFEPVLAFALLEDGDSSDLGALFASLGEEAVRGWLETHPGSLSRRSRGYWRAVLGLERLLDEVGEVDELWPH